MGHNEPKQVDKRFTTQKICNDKVTVNFSHLKTFLEIEIKTC